MINFFKKRRIEDPKLREVERTLALFKEGLNCTQALLSTYGPGFGLDRENALKVAGAFGSGMGWERPAGP